MAKNKGGHDEAGVSGKTRNPQEFLQPDTQFSGQSGNDDDIQSLGKRYPEVSLPAQGLLSRFTRKRHLALLLAVVTGVGMYVGVQDLRDEEKNPSSADLVELAERAATKFAPDYERYARYAGPNAAFVDDYYAEEFCKNVEDFIKDKYIGKDKIADIECTTKKLTITTEDGTVVTATPDGKETITGPGTRLSADFRAVVDEAVRKHTQADDFYAETGFTAPFFTGQTKDDICQKIIDEVNDRFAQEIVRHSCEPYRISFTSDTREVVVATAQEGIRVTSTKPPPKKPGS